MLSRVRKRLSTPLRSTLRATLRATLLATVALLLVAVPVLAIVYAAPLTVVESGGTAYTMLPVSVSVDNQWLADNGFMSASALDTRVETLSGLARPHMVVDDRTLAAVAVPADSQTNLFYTTGNSPLSALKIITGVGGFVTGNDDAALELGNDFAIEQSGWVDTSDSDNNLIYKEAAFRTYVSGVGDITSQVAEVIDVGADATSRPQSGGSGNTYVSLDNPANINGVIGTVEVWAATNITGFRVGTFYLVGGTDYKVRDSETIGAVTSGAKQTFTGLSIDVEAGDYLGYYFDTGSIEGNDAGFAGVYFIASEEIDPGDQATYALQAGRAYSAYGSGSVFSVSVTAAGVSSGEHVIETTYDGADLKIFIDAVEEDTTAWVGAVPDNANDWVIGSDATPYTDYYSHTVGGVEVARYEPVTMILGREYSTGTVTVTNGDATVEGAGTTWTSAMAGSILVSADGLYYVASSVTDADTLELTAVYAGGTLGGQTYALYPRLPDTVGTYDGAITWGANPAGVSVSLDSMVAASQPSIGADIDDPTRDILPVAPASDWFEAPDVTGALLTNPLRPFVTIMSDTTTLTERQAWTWLGITFVLFVLVLTAKSVRGHYIITGVATGVAIGALVALTIFPLYALVFVIVAILGGMVAERSPSL